MLRFKQFISLTEAKIDDLMDKTPELNTSHDPDGQFKDKNDIISHIHQHVPNGNIQHTRWAVDQYHKGNFKQEDTPNLKDTLDNFNKHKDSLPKKKIEQYKSLSDLHGALHKVIGDKEQEKSKDSDRIVNEGSTKVYDSPNLTIHHVHNKEASCELGKGMPWCTSAVNKQGKPSSENMFDHYNTTSNGKFYIAHLHNEQHPFRKLGIGIGANEFQDENNEKIDRDRLKDLVARNPELKSSGHLNGASVHITNDVNKHIHDLLDNDRQGVMENQHFLNDKSKEIFTDYKHQLSKAESDYTTDKDDLNELKHSRYSSVRKSLARNTLDTDTLEHLSKDVHSGVRQEVAKNYDTPYQSRYHLAMNDPVAHVRGSVDISKFRDKGMQDNIFNNEKRSAIKIKHAINSGREDFHHKVLDDKNLDSDTLHHMAQKFHNSTHNKFVDHPNTGDKTLTFLSEFHKKDPEMLHKMINHKNIEADGLSSIAYYTDNSKLHNEILKHPKTNDTVLRELGGNSNKINTLKGVAKHKLTSPSTLQLMIRRAKYSKNKELLRTIMKRPDITDDTLDNIALQTTDSDIHNELVNHSKIDERTLNSLSLYDNPELRDKILDNHKTDSKTLTFLSKVHQHPNQNSSVAHKKIINHPNVNNKALDHIMHNTMKPDILKMIANHQSSSDDTKKAALEKAKKINPYY